MGSPPADSARAAIAMVAGRLRQQRMALGLTLATVAERSDISVSTLSRLESGKRRPTLELLLPLTEVYQIPLDDLVATPAVGDPRIHLRPIHQRPGRIVVPLSQRTDDLRAFKVLLSPRPEPDEPPKLVTHHGTDWLYVLSGRLRIWLGDNQHVVQAGEAAEFDCAIPHGFTADGDELVEFLNLMHVDGQRVHQHDF